MNTFTCIRRYSLGKYMTKAYFLEILTYLYFSRFWLKPGDLKSFPWRKTICREIEQPCSCWKHFSWKQISVRAVKPTVSRFLPVYRLLSDICPFFPGGGSIIHFSTKVLQKERKKIQKFHSCVPSTYFLQFNIYFLLLFLYNVNIIPVKLCLLSILIRNKYFHQQTILICWKRSLNFVCIKWQYFKIMM